MPAEVILISLLGIDKQMNTKNFDKLTLEILEKAFCIDKSFVFKNGVFYQHLESGIGKIICIDYRGGINPSFIIMVGHNYFKTDELGLPNPKYFTGGSLHHYPKKFPAFNTEIIAKGLQRVLICKDDIIFPFLDSVNTTSEYIEVISKHEHLIKYKDFIVSKGNNLDPSR